MSAATLATARKLITDARATPLPNRGGKLDIDGELATRIEQALDQMHADAWNSAIMTERRRLRDVMEVRAKSVARDDMPPSALRILEEMRVDWLGEVQ